jgi:hemoglobin
MDAALADLAAVNATLYQRLGGAVGVAAVVDDAVDRHAANPALAPRLRGQDLPQLKALVVRFLSAASGGPSLGAPTVPAPQHAGMRFSPAELHAVVVDVAEALVEQGVGADEVGEVVSLIRTMNRMPPGD